MINIEGNHLVLEHFDYKDRLLRIIEGDNARDIYLTLSEDEWVTRYDHAGYIGKELASAELNIQQGMDFTQDGA